MFSFYHIYFTLFDPLKPFHSILTCRTPLDFTHKIAYIGFGWRGRKLRHAAPSTTRGATNNVRMGCRRTNNVFAETTPYHRVRKASWRRPISFLRAIYSNFEPSAAELRIERCSARDEALTQSNFEPFARQGRKARKRSSKPRCASIPGHTTTTDEKLPSARTPPGSNVKAPHSCSACARDAGCAAPTADFLPACNRNTR